MGNTTQSQQITPVVQPSTPTGVACVLTAVTSSGVYFNVGDTSKIVMMVVNASSSDNGAVWVEPGAKWAGARGLTISTTASAYSTSTAPVVMSVPLHGVTGSSAFASTTGSIAFFSFDSATVKSSDEKIYVVASTGSTKMYAGVYAMTGGSTQ